MFGNDQNKSYAAAVLKFILYSFVNVLKKLIIVIF